MHKAIHQQQRTDEYVFSETAFHDDDAQQSPGGGPQSQTAGQESRARAPASLRGDEVRRDQAQRESHGGGFCPAEEARKTHQTSLPPAAEAVRTGLLGQGPLGGAGVAFGLEGEQAPGRDPASGVEASEGVFAA